MANKLMPRDDRLPPNRLQPPEGIGIRERKVWEMVVNSPDLAANHFKSSDTPLLWSYCSVVVQAFLVNQKLGKDLEKTGAMIISGNGSPAPHPLLNTSAKLATTLSGLAARLWISPSSRLPTKNATTGNDGLITRKTDEIDELFMH